MSKVDEIRLQGLPKGLLELESLRALIQDATNDTKLWLAVKGSEEERVYIREIQGRLSDLDGIITRRMQRRNSAKDAGDWPATVRAALSLLDKATGVRGSVVGKSWARLRNIEEAPAVLGTTAGSKPTRTARTNRREALLKPLLDEKGLSVHDWAKAAEVDFHTANNYLKGKTQPYPSTLKKLAHALGIEVANLPT